jgi:molybdopterin/thiamine biosynthesis adenylyltransferase
MANAVLTPEARRENTETLKAVLGLDEHAATSLLDISLSVAVDRSNPIDHVVASDVLAMLSRTVQRAYLAEPDQVSSCELVIGGALPVGTGPKLYLRIGREHATLSTTPLGGHASHPIPKILALLVACYSSAAMLFHSTGGKLPFELPDPFEFSYDALGIDASQLARSFSLGHAYLAGAGAIGNGLLWALRYLSVHGQLDIVDDDTISSGNLNRQMWFEAEDIGLLKAETLAKKAQAQMPDLKLVPRPMRLQSLPEKSAGAWLRRLIVAVDSRRARRELQNEFPGEVFDASTTDIREIVIHHHLQPTDDACMSCIYEPDKEEFKREQHIADHLGVTIDEVRTERISGAAAFTIAQRFGLSPTEIVGTAYDSLFKSLCSQGQLGEIADKRTVAPLAFVSVLAGALLAIELCRQLGNMSTTAGFNYWRVSPWFPPLGRRRVLRPRQPGCAFCGQPALRRVNSQLWSVRSA